MMIMPQSPRHILKSPPCQARAARLEKSKVDGSQLAVEIRLSAQPSFPSVVSPFQDQCHSHFRHHA
jgi:hypothetical protein